MFNRFAVSLAAALCLAHLGHAQPPAVIPPPEPMPTDKAAPVFADNCGADSSGDRWWVSADYLFGWVRSSRLPPLVTTSPAGTPQASAGVVGQPGTTVLFGNSDVVGDMRPGIRLGMGAWLNSEHTFGVDSGFFLLGSQSDLFFANSPTGTPILARPFVNATSGAQASQLIAFPGVSTGAVAASLRSDNFIGTHLDFQENILTDGGFRLDSLLGYGYLHINERLAVETNQTAGASTVFVPGTQIFAADKFTASNTFNGVDLGIKGEYVADGWSLGFVSKLAVGNLHRAVGIAGTTRVTVPGEAAVTSNGGLLALASNSGAHTSNDWVVAPEFGVTAGWAIRPDLHLRIGYTFLQLSDVARAADQVDLHVNPNLIPPAQAGATPRSPSFHLTRSDIWIQTLSLGMEFDF